MKNTDAIATITNTMAVVIAVSRRVGQVTLDASERTSCRNLNGLTFAIRQRLFPGNIPPPHGSIRPNGTRFTKFWWYRRASDPGCAPRAKHLQAQIRSPRDWVKV